MASENEFLLYSFLIGVFITFVYDLLRIFRRVVPHAGFFVSLEDLAFWIYCGAEVFLLMYRESNGTLRWFAVIGALTGMLLYKKLISKWFVKYVSMALTKLLGILGKLLRWLSSPFRALAGKTARNVHKTGGRVHRQMGKVKRRIKNKLTYTLKVFKMGFKA